MSVAERDTHVVRPRAAGPREWAGEVSDQARRELRAVATALAKDAAAADELERWLLLGHAALHAWACAERQIAELKDAAPATAVRR